MEKSLMIVVAVLLISTVSMAQEKNREGFADLAISGGSDVFSTSLSWINVHGVGAKKKIQIGYGVRFSQFGGADLIYTTAPFDLSKDPSTVDSLFVGTANTFSLNAVIHIQYKISPKFRVGFNIDAIGLAFGGNQKVQFTSTENSNFNGEYTASPSAFNLLLVGDNDIGQLKSEFYVSYEVTKKWVLRAGFDYTFSEYTTATSLAYANDRFRHKATMFFVAGSFRLY